jgi:hypothetical protein
MKKSFKALLVAGSLIALNGATPANAWDYYPYYPYGGYYGYSYGYPDIGAAIANARIGFSWGALLAGPAHQAAQPRVYYYAPQVRCGHGTFYSPQDGACHPLPH